ncbi:unnamed protein product [Calypogeia fissa]
MAGLEGSFSQLMNKHSQRQVARLNRLEIAKKEAFSAAAKVSSLLVESVNGGVQESFLSEQRIEHEARALAGTVQRFTKQSVQWLTVFHNFDSALKEIGDFENWIKVTEYDLESIGNALGYLASSGGNVSK